MSPEEEAGLEIKQEKKKEMIEEEEEEEREKQGERWRGACFSLQ